mgnify:CR=1 FL=1
MFYVEQSRREQKRALRPFETVEKVANATFSSRPHEISGSISCEIVAQNFVRGVISQAHVLGNDWISFYSAVCGRRNSLQEGFFDTLKNRSCDTAAVFVFRKDPST